MRRLQRSVGLAILFLAQIALVRADSVSDGLKQAYQNRILGVRYPFHGGNQQFDSAGHPLTAGPVQAWELYGGVLIEKIHLKKDRLGIEGVRVALTGREEKGTPVVIKMRKATFEIHLDHPLVTMDEARIVLGRVFYLDESDTEHRQPELRRTGDNALKPFVFKSVKDTPGFAPPKPQYTPEPEFSEQARRSHFQGAVKLSVLIDPQGTVAAVRLDQGVGEGLDENAMETVKNWRFSPATKDGAAVSVWMPVEVEFHLYGH